MFDKLFYLAVYVYLSDGASLQQIECLQSVPAADDNHDWFFLKVQLIKFLLLSSRCVEFSFCLTVLNIMFVYSDHGTHVLKANSHMLDHLGTPFSLLGTINLKRGPVNLALVYIL